MKKDPSKCCVLNCKTRRLENSNEDVHFHRFPKRNENKVTILNTFGREQTVDRRLAWLKILQIGKQVLKSTKVCSKHFKQSDYKTFGRCAKKLKLVRLRPTAVPSINLPSRNPMFKIVGEVENSPATTLLQQPEVSATQPIKLQGRRIVDIGYLFEQMATLLQHDPLNCKWQHLEVIEEIPLGLSSALFFKCKNCGFQSRLKTNPNKQFTDNAVLCVLNSDINPQQFDQLLTSVNIPALTMKTFRTSEKWISKAMQTDVFNSMKQAAEQEAKLAHQTTAGRPLVPVVVDSADDRLVIFGVRTRKILFFGVAKHFCAICARASALGPNPWSHRCLVSNNALKNQYIYEAFQQSDAMYGIIYNRMLADVECEYFEDLLQDYNSRLLNLTVKSENSNVPITLRNELRAKLSSFSDLLVKSVLFRRRGKDEISVKCDLLKKDIENLPSHVFEEHEKCTQLGSNCSQVYTKSELVEQMRKCGYFDEIISCSKIVLDSVKTLLGRFETIEAFHSEFNELCSMKTKEAYGIKCMTAVLKYNLKNEQVVESGNRVIGVKIEAEDVDLISN